MNEEKVKQKAEERRLCACELRVGGEADAESRTVEGYAFLFDSRSQDLGGFVEEIAPGAADGMIEQSDIFAYLNHQSYRGVLARSKNGVGSLELTLDDKGLRYKFEAPHTAGGEELLEGLRRGEIDSSSFAFRVDKEEWTKEVDGRWLRRIIKFRELCDVSPVWQPAYTATTCDLRGMEAAKAAEANQAKELIEAEWRNIDKLISNI